MPVTPLPLPPWMCRACCMGARAWPLGGLPPGSALTILSRISRACSSGSPLTPNGGGAPPLHPRPDCRSPLSPSTQIFLAVGGGGLCRSWILPPISCIRPRTRGVRSCLVGAPLHLYWSRPPSFPCMPCGRSTCCSGFKPPSTSWSPLPTLPLSPESRAQGKHAAWGVPPLPHLGPGVPP